MTLRLAFAFLAPCLIALPACSSSSPGASDDSRAGAGGVDGRGGSSSSGGSAGQGTAGMTHGGAMSQAGTSVGGASAGGGGASAGGSQGVAGTGGIDPGSGGSTGSEYGFSFRAPSEKNLDWLCTYHQDQVSGYVYVRLLQTGMQSAGIAMVPVYAVQLAQISIDGKVSMLEGVEYEYGGGHHNDALAFDYAGKSQRYYHSSFGFGFRKCQNMDCRDVYGLASTTLETEGCASDRMLPEVCVSFAPDGTHAALTDAFMKCPGDTK
jgi:hypothetical protein